MKPKGRIEEIENRIDFLQTELCITPKFDEDGQIKQDEFLDDIQKARFYKELKELKKELDQLKRVTPT